MSEADGNGRGGGVAVSLGPDLSPGKCVNYELRRESIVRLLKLTSDGREQELRSVCTLGLSATVGGKDPSERIMVSIAVGRLRASVRKRRGNASTEASIALDPHDEDIGMPFPLPSLHLVPECAFRKAPLRLLLDGGGRLVGLLGAEELRAAEETLFRKDFTSIAPEDSLKVALSGELTDEALFASWRDLLIPELPPTAWTSQSREEWEDRGVERLSAFVPVRDWAAPVEVSTRRTTTLMPRGDGTFLLSARVALADGQSVSTRMGDSPWAYTVEAGEGKRSVGVGGDGWVSSLESTTCVRLSSVIERHGKGIPLNVSLTRECSLRRLTEA